MEADKLRNIVPEKEIAQNLAMGKALDLVRDSAVVKEVREEPAKEEKPKKASKPRAKKAKVEEAPAAEPADGSAE